MGKTETDSRFHNRQFKCVRDNLGDADCVDRGVDGVAEGGGAVGQVFVFGVHDRGGTVTVARKDCRVTYQGNNHQTTIRIKIIILFAAVNALKP